VVEVRDEMEWCETGRDMVIVAISVHTSDVSVLQANEKRRFEEESTASSRGRSRQRGSITKLRGEQFERSASQSLAIVALPQSV
jgi:hypothetical protein